MNPLKIRGITKPVTVKSLDDITLSFITRHAQKHSANLSKKKLPVKIELDPSRWIVRANSDGGISLLSYTI